MPKQSHLIAFAFTVVISLPFPSLNAQIERVEREAFSPKAVGTSFTEFNGAGGPATDFLGTLGVRLASEGEVDPTLIQVAISFGGVLIAVRNQPDGSSAQTAMIVVLDQPATRVGLTLGNGGPGVIAKLRAFTVTGVFLGEILEQDIPRESPTNFTFGKFVGLQSGNRVRPARALPCD